MDVTSKSHINSCHSGRQSRKMILVSIKKRADFLQLANSKIRFHSKSSLVISGKTSEKYLTNPHTKKRDEVCRLGITVSKKIGKAVIRNKIKRRFRNIFLQLVQENQTISGFDYVVIAKKEIVNFDFQKITDDLKFCLKHTNRIIKENERK